MSDVPMGVLGGGILLWLTRELWGVIINRKRDKAETEANITLVNGLAARVELLEKHQLDLEARLAREMQLRMDAQQTAHELMLRVQTLESMLRGLGATIPART